MQNALERDCNPVRAVVQLIAKLINGLFEEKGFQEDLEFLSGEDKAKVLGGNAARLMNLS